MNFGIRGIKFKFDSIDPIKDAKYFRILLTNDNYKWISIKEVMKVQKEIDYEYKHFDLFRISPKKTYCEIKIAKKNFFKRNYIRSRML